MGFHGVRVFSILLLVMGLLTACSEGEDSAAGTDTGNGNSAAAVALDESASTLQVRQFVADLQTWQGDIELAPEQASFNGVGEVAAKTATKEMTEMLQVIAVAGQQATIVALPELFLKRSCDQLGNWLLKASCHTLTNGKSLNEICNFALNINIGGKPICDWLSLIAMPIDPQKALTGNGIINYFEIFDGNSEVRGYDNHSDTRMNIRLTDSSHQGNEVYFSIAGTASQGDTELTIESGELRFQYDVLDGSKVVFPKAAQLLLQVTMTSDATSKDSTQVVAFDGEISAAIVFEEQKPMHELLGLENLSIAILANGLYSNEAGNVYPTQFKINNAEGPEYKITLEVHTNDLNTAADISFDSQTVDVSNERLSFTLAWDDRSYQITRDPANPQRVMVENQEKVSLFVDYGALDNKAGLITIDGKNYGEVSFLNGSLLISLIDGTELIL